MSVVASVLLLAVVAVEGQSLGEAAKREQERRKAQATKPVRSFSDEDLPSSPVPLETDASVPARPEPSPSPSADAGPGLGIPDDETERKQLEALWRARFDEARAKLRTAESRAFEDRVEVAWKAGIPYQTMVRVPVETEELKSARRTLADLEEEFRRTGFPPGWARE